MRKNRLGYYLTGKDMLEAVGGKSKIITYPDLDNYNSIEDLLDPYGAIFLLYEYQKGVGHWTLLFRQGDTIEHFDSYNYKPDEEFKFIPDYFRKVNDMMYPKLTKMLYDSGKDIHYNNFELQADGDNIATCGRWCITRLMFKDMNIDQFHDMFQFLKKKTGLSLDEIVYYLTDEYPKST